MQSGFINLQTCRCKKRKEIKEYHIIQVTNWQDDIGVLWRNPGHSDSIYFCIFLLSLFSFFCISFSPQSVKADWRPPESGSAWGFFLQGTFSCPLSLWKDHCFKMALDEIWRFIHKSWMTEFQVSDNPGYRISHFAITHIKIQCVRVFWFAIFIWLHFNFNASLTYLLHVALCISQFLSWLLCLELSKTTLEQKKSKYVWIQ